MVIGSIDWPRLLKSVYLFVCHIFTSKRSFQTENFFIDIKIFFKSHDKCSNFSLVYYYVSQWFFNYYFLYVLYLYLGVMGSPFSFFLYFARKLSTILKCPFNHIVLGRKCSFNVCKACDFMILSLFIVAITLPPPPPPLPCKKRAKTLFVKKSKKLSLKLKK